MGVQILTREPVTVWSLVRQLRFLWPIITSIQRRSFYIDRRHRCSHMRLTIRYSITFILPCALVERLRVLTDCNTDCLAECITEVINLPFVIEFGSFTERKNKTTTPTQLTRPQCDTPNSVTGLRRSRTLLSSDNSTWIAAPERAPNIWYHSRYTQRSNLRAAEDSGCCT